MGEVSPKLSPHRARRNLGWIGKRFIEGDCSSGRRKEYNGRDKFVAYDEIEMVHGEE